MNIDYYLCQTYSSPPCWELVSEVYKKELNINLEHFTCENTPSAIAKAFRKAILSYSINFNEVGVPEDMCIVLCKAHKNSTATHVGVYFKGRVLHCCGETRFDDLTTLSIQYQEITFHSMKEE